MAAVGENWKRFIMAMASSLLEIHGEKLGQRA
jgi:hypothetical protein